MYRICKIKVFYSVGAVNRNTVLFSTEILYSEIISLTQAKRICMCETQNPFHHTPLHPHSDIHPHNMLVCTLRMKEK